LNKIADLCGVEQANHVLINLAISRNALDALHNASPVLKRRRMIDANYWKVVSNWGGGYPRPYSEFIY